MDTAQISASGDVRPRRRSAAGDRAAHRRLPERACRADAARRHRLGQDLHDRERHPERCSARRWSSRTTRRWPRSCTASSSEFFPDNAVEYFVSYYDYYQPEAYVPSSRHVHREGLLGQRAHRADAAVGDQGAARAARRDHRGDRVGDLRPRRSAGLSRDGAAPQSRRPHGSARAAAPARGHAVHAQRHGSHAGHAIACAATSSTSSRRSPSAKRVRVELFDDDIDSHRAVRSADRRDPAQGAALHGLSGHALRDAEGAAGRRRRLHPRGAAHAAARCCSEQDKLRRGAAAASSARRSTWR